MTKITEQRLSELNCSTITDREIRKLVKAYRKAKHGDEWIEWDGDPGGPDLPPSTMVKTKWSNGNDYGVSSVRWWGGHGVNNWDRNTSVHIIAYRVVRK